MHLQRFGFLATLAVLPAVAQVDTERTSHQHGSAIIQQRPDGSSTSNIWSGYVVNCVTGNGCAPGSVTDVKGSWIVPQITCNGITTAQSSFWVGIDGANFTGLPPNNTLEQIGTLATCNCLTPPCYSAWYEFLPTQAVAQPIHFFSVHPGDRISAEVSALSTVDFTATITNERTGTSKTFSQPSSFPGGLLSSAEWIAEAPTLNDSIAPLANFGTVLFGQRNSRVANTCVATVAGVTQSIGNFPSANTFRVTMENTGVIEAVPSSFWPMKPTPTGVGSSFSVVFADDHYSRAVLADKPVAYYRLGESQGTPSAIDSSGEGNKGTYENGPALGQTGLIADTTNTAVNFASGDVVIPDAPSINFVSTAFTIEAWVNGTYASQMRVFDKVEGGTPNGYGLDVANDNVRIIGNGPNLSVLTTLVAGTTYHIVATSDGLGTGSVYVDASVNTQNRP